MLETLLWYQNVMPKFLGMNENFFLKKKPNNIKFANTKHTNKFVLTMFGLTLTTNSSKQNNI